MCFLIKWIAKVLWILQQKQQSYKISSHPVLNITMGRNLSRCFNESENSALDVRDEFYDIIKSRKKKVGGKLYKEIRASMKSNRRGQNNSYNSNVFQISKQAAWMEPLLARLVMWLCGWQSRSGVHHFGPDWTTIGWIGHSWSLEDEPQYICEPMTFAFSAISWLKLSRDIHCSPTLNPTDIKDPLFLSLGLPAGRHCWIWITCLSNY